MTTLAWGVVAEQLRRDIQSGWTGPNGELDTEAELCRRFSTSRITVRRALAELRADGMVISQRGSGTRAVLPPVLAVSLVTAAGGEDAEHPTLTRTKVRRRTTRPASDLSMALRRAGLAEAPRGQWLRLTYDHRVDGTLFDEATVWFAPRIVPYVVRQDIATGPKAKHDR